MLNEQKHAFFWANQSFSERINHSDRVMITVRFCPASVTASGLTMSQV
jgi:hypothetical protein